MIQTMQQKRAKYALNKVKDALDRNIDKKEYKSYASGLPAMIHTNGLGQAAAFYRSKKSDTTHRCIYDVLSNWLTGENQALSDYNDLLEGITASNIASYQLAQAEAQALMSWVKKFAKAYMSDEDAKTEQEG